jgi:hypothetical protein
LQPFFFDEDVRKEMKKYFYAAICLLIALSMQSCKDETAGPDPAKGRLLINSEPGGADIIINDIPAGKETPSAIGDLDTGFIKITLSLPGFRDTTFFSNVISEYQRTVNALLSEIPENPDTIHFKEIKLYEQSVYHETGLNLESGKIVSVLSDSADLFFNFGTGEKSLRSQHLRDPDTRNKTYFYNMQRVSLNDGMNSTAFQSDPDSWLFDNGNNQGYSFVYNKSRNYSKIKIVRIGVDGPFENYVIIDYIYNKVPKDVRF